MPNTINRARGLVVRRALLAVVRAAHAKGLPLPRQSAIAAAVGIDSSQVCRHLRQLADQGAYTPKRVWRRIHVQEMRP